MLFFLYSAQYRINKTLKELQQLAKRLKQDGLTSAAKFIANSANYMITFARLAAKGITVPYTNNLIERLMGEIAKRVKNKWVHWSTTGLENLLNILLFRYCNSSLFKKIKEKFNKNNTSMLIQVAIT